VSAPGDRTRVVVVVGGGVVGRSLARAAARAGLDATLLADGGPAASSVPVALLNPHRGRTGRAHPEDLAALATTWRWASELAAEGLDPGAHRTGALRVADGPKQARAFAAAGLAPADADAAGVRAPHGAFLVPDGGWLEPDAWLAALTRSAQAHGARCLEGRTVTAAERRPDGGWRLRLDDADAATLGDRVGGGAEDRRDRAEPAAVDGDRLVFATGGAEWPAALAASVGPAPHVERIAGDVVVTRHPAPALPIAGGTYVGPVARGGGRVAAIGGHHRPPGAPGADAAARLRAAARWTLPGLEADEPDDRVWWGVRAKLPSGRPEVHRLAPGVRWVGGFAGRGFLAAAAVAEALVAALAAEAGD
jgi:glycine/D-amino acid oxidase-like deaminating enzyme